MRGALGSIVDGRPTNRGRPPPADARALFLLLAPPRFLERLIEEPSEERRPLIARPASSSSAWLDVAPPAVSSPPASRCAGAAGTAPTATGSPTAGTASTARAEA